MEMQDDFDICKWMVEDKKDDAFSHLVVVVVDADADADANADADDVEVQCTMQYKLH